MKHHLTIEVKRHSIALERFMRVIRHRGFNLMSMTVDSTDDHYVVSISVDSDRPIHLLTKQLKKLVEVHQVKVLDDHSFTAMTATN